MPVADIIAIVFTFLLALAVVVVLVAMIKPKWLKITLGVPKYFGLTVELGSGPDAKKPGPKGLTGPAD